MNYPIQINKTMKSRLPEVDFADLAFGKHYSDHMFIADWYDGEWRDLRIVPYEALALVPSTFALHYGQAIFEGLKAYKNNNGEDLFFRLDQNAKRFNISASRMGMPEVPEDLFSQACNELIHLDSGWVPKEDGASLYVRPFMFAADEHIGIRPTKFFKFIVITSPSGIYYNKPVKVLVADKYVRAFPGGVGYAKAAGNYGATMLPLLEAQAQGYDQILWVDGMEKKYAEEIGTMNFFVFINDILLTPELDGTILDGVTRSSVIELARSYGVKVEERKVSIDEIVEGIKNGKLADAFGVGTAAAVIPISHLGIKGEKMELCSLDKRPLSFRLKKDLDDMKFGNTADKFGWITKVKTNLVEVS